MQDIYPDPKAPELVRCPGCRSNHKVFVDRQRQDSRGVLKSQMLECFYCNKCDRKFQKIGLPAVTAGAFAAALFVLLIF